MALGKLLMLLLVPKLLDLDGFSRLSAMLMALLNASKLDWLPKAILSALDLILQRSLLLPPDLHLFASFLLSLLFRTYTFIPLMSPMHLPMETWKKQST